jgi:ankyrin repeat protein
MFEMDFPSESLNLLELALRLHWSSAAARSSLFPEEIEEQDEDGLNVLHWACCNMPPIRFLQELRVQDEFFERAACTKDAGGMTPLLCACACRASPEVISYLIDACPESVALCDNEEWTALHYLTCCYKNWEGTLQDLNVLSKKLLSIHPNLAIARNASQRTPLQTLCDTYQLELQNYYYGANSKVEGEVLVLWEIIRTFVKQQSLDSTASILHGLMCFPQCPVELLMVASRIHPELLYHRDARGNTPLHLAVAAKFDLLTIFLSQKGPAAAGMRNDKGETPFCIARKTYEQWSKVHGFLLGANPASIGLAELKHSLYPELFSRTTDSANTIFELLRTNPTLLVSGWPVVGRE